MKKIRVLLADDHRIFLEGLKKLLEGEFDILDAVEDGRALVQAAEKLSPDVIVADVSLPSLNGLEAALQLSEMSCEAKLIFLTMHGDPLLLRQALLAGASGYILKRDAPDVLVSAIRQVVRGKLCFTQELLQGVEQGPPAASQKSLGRLTARQREILHLVADPGRHTAVYQTGPATNGHTNQVIEAGPDSGSEDRLYSGVDQGLVLFAMSFRRCFLPGEDVGTTDANGNPVIAQTPHLEETLSADLANTVDNYRSLQPLSPRTHRYSITLPSSLELAEMGVRLKGPLHVHARVNYEHFLPMTLRFVARTTSAEGPAGHDLNLMNEPTLDGYLRTIGNIASDDFTIQMRN